MKEPAATQFFEESDWRVVALRHMGNEAEALTETSRFAKSIGRVNEGISIASICDAIRNR